MKNKIYKLVSTGSNFFGYFIMSLIVLSVISIILESIAEVNNSIGNFLFKFNVFTISMFTIEYIMRMYVSDLTHPAKSKIRSMLKFATSPFGLIDLFAILPFYLPMLIKIDLRFLRVIRLSRFLRILKINRYNNSLVIIWKVIKEKRSELAVTGFITFLILVFASFLMYNIEGQEQPEAFPNVLAAFWWAISTLTTVGYGDIYPVSAFGKVLSSIIAILGIGIVALPTGIISAGFVSKIRTDNNKKQTTHICPHCGNPFDSENTERHY